MRTLLRLFAIGASLVIVLSFAMFAADQGAKGRDEQLTQLQQEAGTPAPAAAAERQRERQHGRVREVIEDANDFLLKPFVGVAPSSNPWVARSVPALLGLLTWGLLLGFLANLLPQRRREIRDWRTGQPI
ncbi:hypothetical protein [Thermoleophilum album]|uniref:Uncharacterized protein n=1 Tax=Thermoleophilum album TaxID=29539 RepID=A0A1H6FN48_THEAL|nr:hypothetical protein [Thermoleophilum album]SEH11273.1 hypothetical protein SAMN02745716_0714 [Thermoleophilum album]